MIPDFDHEAIQHVHSTTSCPCVGCNGMTGWYDPDNGQWVGCGHCEAGKARIAKDAKHSRDAFAMQINHGDE